MEYTKGLVLNKRYEIDRLLGSGAAGTVYKAIDQVNSSTVAIKIFFIEDDTLEEFEKRRLYFRREVELLKRISHPNVVCVLDSGISELGELFLVMEYVEGTMLSELINLGPLELSRITNLLNQMGTGLQAIHSQGIIHRDFKPQNVLIVGQEPYEQVKLLDFGIAKMIRGDTEEAFLQTLTSDGAVVGTVYYMSPEQCEGKPLDERTDIYALGITVYEMLNGEPPFYNENTFKLMLAHTKLPPPDLPWLPTAIHEVVFRALAKPPTQRFASAVEFAQTFALAVEQSQSTIVVEESQNSAISEKHENSSAPNTTRIWAPTPERPTLRTMQNQEEKRTFWRNLLRWKTR
ncbi:MAG: serine/threonine-protein kinase [Acidobacteriota bacterium]